ncbi:hypothetical protein BZL54_22235 [Burkholderia ubonensis subsp. mesacidophila]|uniref:Uncharacterized protein n=1 Tax=Burkholderia ubonensis subsp. mesacidophila TaxID=265293 RepID=A0A2A4F9W2_9BURK|nr:hypothetical protein BZL54_22235 [Burkholderia ubonensis subsp. mesacidophila]
MTDRNGSATTTGIACRRHRECRGAGRRGLEKRVCECYDLVKREFDRLLPDLKRLEQPLHGNVPTSPSHAPILCPTPVHLTAILFERSDSMRPLATRAHLTSEDL